jgi:hypothetical protein
LGLATSFKGLGSSSSSSSRGRRRRRRGCSTTIILHGHLPSYETLAQQISTESKTSRKGRLRLRRAMDLWITLAVNFMPMA